MVQRVRARGGQYGGGLGDIQGAAPAEAQDSVTARLAQLGQGGPYHLDRRLGLDGEDDASYAALGQRGADRSDPRYRATGDDQDTPGAKPGQDLRHLTDPAGPETYVGRDRELEAD